MDALAEILDGQDETPAEATAFVVPGMPPRLPPGIYFGLPEAQYHADPALGSGSVRSLATHPVYYWQSSWMNPLRVPDEETPALLYGRALHSLVLEGSEKFQASYARYPLQSDHPNALDLVRDIKAVLKGLGAKFKSTDTKPILQQLLRETDPTAELWDDIIDGFEKDCRARGATVLKADVYQRVVAAAKFIAAEERVRTAFTRGMCEVSVFWEVDGIPLKARLDYVRLGRDGDRQVGLITDLKSFANKYDLPPERAVINAIMQTRLDIQAAQYLDGASRIPAFIAEGKVFGWSTRSDEWLQALAGLEAGDWRWFWCFYEKEAPVAMLRSTRPGSALIQCATTAYNRALESYRDYVGAFGTDWHFVDPVPDTELTAEDFPKYFGA